MTIMGRIRAALGRRPNRLAVEATEPEWADAARRLGQRPVFADWVGIYTIGPDGSPYFAEYLDLRDQFVITDALHRNIVWFRAAERYPDLVHLRPVRGPTDPVCTSCGGSGLAPVPTGTERNIWCRCGGVGWLPAGYVDPHRDADA